MALAGFSLLLTSKKETATHFQPKVISLFRILLISTKAFLLILGFIENTKLV
jgi:hypothetical protein